MIIGNLDGKAKMPLHLLPYIPVSTLPLVTCNDNIFWSPYEHSADLYTYAPGDISSAICHPVSLAEISIPGSDSPVGISHIVSHVNPSSSPSAGPFKEQIGAIDLDLLSISYIFLLTGFVPDYFNWV